MTNTPEGYQYPPPPPLPNGPLHTGQAWEAPRPPSEWAGLARMMGPQPTPVFIQMPQQPAQPVYAKRVTNHGLHIILDLATCLLWTPVHLAVWIYNESSQPRRVA